MMAGLRDSSMAAMMVVWTVEKKVESTAASSVA